MLRRQGLPPSCPHPEKWLVPVRIFRFPSCPAYRTNGISQTLGIRVLCRGNVAEEGIKDGNHFPLLGISLQLRRSRSCGSPGLVQRTVSKRPGTGRAFEPYGSRAPQLTPGGQRDFGPLPPEAHRFLHRGRWQFRHKPDACSQFLKLEMRPQEDHTLVRARIPGILAYVHAGLT